MDLELTQLANSFKRARFSTPLSLAESCLAAQYFSWALNRQRREAREEFSRPIHMAQWCQGAGLFKLRSMFKEERVTLALISGPIEAARLADMLTRQLKTSSDFHSKYLKYNFSSERAQLDLAEEIEIAILVDRVVDRLKYLYGKPKMFRLLPENKPGQKKVFL